MLRALSVILVAALAVPARSQQALPVLLGSIENGVYSSPTSAFKVPVLVLPELGGKIRDNDNMVMFQDAISTHISVGAFKQDATQRWEMETRGTKDYLVYFFGRFGLADLKRNWPDSKVESASFAATYLDGSLFCYTLIPGGSMFAAQVLALDPEAKPPVAKRGNLLFVKNGFVFVVSTELAEKVTEGSRYNKTQDEEDQILHKRLMDIAAKIRFTAPAAAPASAPAPTPAK